MIKSHEVKKMKTVATSIRLEKELLDKIKADAKKEGRSITKQIEIMIKAYYEIKKL